MQIFNVQDEGTGVPCGLGSMSSTCWMQSRNYNPGVLVATLINLPWRKWQLSGISDTQAFLPFSNASHSSRSVIKVKPSHQWIHSWRKEHKRPGPEEEWQKPKRVGIHLTKLGELRSMHFKLSWGIWRHIRC